MSELICESRILEAFPAGDILEIAFRGIHEWTHGREMSRFIKQTIGDSSPAAVVINLLDYEYRFGDDVSGLFEAFIDRKRNVLRPSCIAATGLTHESMYPFFARSRIFEAFQVQFVSSVEEALERLRERSRS